MNRARVFTMTILLGCLATLAGTVGSASQAHAGVSSCRATALRSVDGVAAARVGPVLFSGFDSTRHATLPLPPVQTASVFDARLARLPATPITITGRRCGAAIPLRLRAVRSTQALTLPPTMHGRGQISITLGKPYRYYGIYPFFTAPGTWTLTLRSGSGAIGTLTVDVHTA